jgi:hypothetical protein
MLRDSQVLHRFLGFHEFDTVGQEFGMMAQMSKASA